MPDFAQSEGKRGMKRLFCTGVALLLLSTGAALAGHGKVGLWNISTSVNMAMAVPPEVMAEMKKAGMRMPPAQTINTQMCMTKAEVESDKPPQIGNNDPGCDTHILRQTASSMAADTICSGKLRGVGHIEVAYGSAEHYTGSYSFKGSVQGRPDNLSTSFRGDWVKADCGAVKPYTANN